MSQSYTPADGMFSYNPGNGTLTVSPILDTSADNGLTIDDGPAGWASLRSTTGTPLIVSSPSTSPLWYFNNASPIDINLEKIVAALRDSKKASPFLEAFVPFLKLIGLEINRDGDVAIGLSDANRIVFRADGKVLWRDMELELPEQISSALTLCFDHMIGKLTETVHEKEIESVASYTGTSGMPVVTTSMPTYDNASTSLGGTLTTNTAMLGVDQMGYIVDADPYQKTVEENAKEKVRKVQQSAMQNFRLADMKKAKSKKPHLKLLQKFHRKH